MPNIEANYLHVAVGVVRDSSAKILIARRLKGKHLGGLWEFPGGKVESGENVRDALVREFEEEVGILPRQFEPLIQLNHQYPDRSVKLDVFVINQFDGVAFGKEGQEMRWVGLDSLSKFHFPDVNAVIITALKLPQKIAITGKFENTVDFISKITRLSNKEIPYVQIRAPWLSENDYFQLCNTAVSHNKNHGLNLELFANCDPDVFKSIPIANLHLPSKYLYSLNQRPNIERGMLSASCHSVEELALAESLGVDFVYVSPIDKTVSHPERKSLGWRVFREICEVAKIPVYALGGLKNRDLAPAQESGGQGIAAITSFWNGG